MFTFLKKDKPKRAAKFSILNRPYRSYINGIYLVMYYGKKIEILPEFRLTPTATHGYVAGMSKLGYIIITVIDQGTTFEHHYEAYMLD